MERRSSRQKIVVILGPTASGKSELAVKLAERWNGEIISADSRQVYKGLDIGSGKITKKEMRGIPHYLLDVASPKRTFTVATYQKLGNAAIKKILKKGKLPIIVGGTGFYIDALMYNYTFPAVKPNPKLRRELEKRSAEELFRRLRELDPKRARTIDAKNTRRLIRAIEIIISTKKPIHKIKKEPRYSSLKLGIRFSAHELKKRIAARLKRRLAQGMAQEVRRLRSEDVSWERLDNFGLEYRYISRYLRDIQRNPSMRTRDARAKARAEMIRTLKREIGRYAKRQMTWFRRDPEIVWLKDARQANKLVKKFLEKERTVPE